MPDNPKTSTRIETLRPNYWRDTALDQMSAAEWEALCDGCGKCCQLKLEDADTGKVSYTNIACRLFDDETCRCTNYPLRKSLVGGCLVLTPESLDYAKDWMPKTCAYRLLAEGEDIPDWHPLKTGSAHSVHEAGVSVQRSTVPEYEFDEDDWFDHIIEEQH